VLVSVFLRLIIRALQCVAISTMGQSSDDQSQKNNKMDKRHKHDRTPANP